MKLSTISKLSAGLPLADCQQYSLSDVFRTAESPRNRYGNIAAYQDFDLTRLALSTVILGVICVWE